MSALPEVKEPGTKPLQQFGEGVYFPPPQGQWTYADYLRLPENDHIYEIDVVFPVESTVVQKALF